MPLSEPSYETVDHPNHYNYFPVECIEIAERMNFNQGSALKYLWRCGRKPGTDPVEDLQKAIWYLQREIQRITGERHDNHFSE